MFANQPSCKICGMKYQDFRFQKDDVRGGALYWANPKLWPGIEEAVDFCGPEHATQWFRENTAARNGEAENTLDQP